MDSLQVHWLDTRASPSDLRTALVPLPSTAPTTTKPVTLEDIAKVANLHSNVVGGQGGKPFSDARLVTDDSKHHLSAITVRHFFASPIASVQARVTRLTRSRILVHAQFVLPSYCFFAAGSVQWSNIG